MAERASERDADGVVVTPSGRAWPKRAWLACAGAICAGVIAVVAIPRGDETQSAAPERAPANGDRAGAVSLRSSARSDSGAAPAAVNAGSAGPAATAPSPQQLAAESAVQQGLAPSGIGLFPPPGTDPVKIGIVVPDDFPLPEGYLRHYQVTDDGQPMPAILMFHPDYELLDARGQPVPLPENRVVPAELAPPGLAIEMLVPPPPRVEEGAP
ncbi:MAG: hypothetical protein FJ091_18195 [Deltaproteobacteria bacterium]|nr:hypothetical protein [Deltaproteobacteria bacterium]